MTRRPAKIGLVTLPFVVTLLIGVLLPGGSALSLERPPAHSHLGVGCPWLEADTGSPRLRASVVVGKMTLAQKVGFIDLISGHHGFENSNTAIPNLCIPMLTLEDGPNGIAYNKKGMTQLPASIATAATFDPSLATAYGRLLGLEALAEHVDAVQGPNLNLVRVPNSGRSFETFGEDPMLASALGVAEVEGIQSVGAIAEPKHVGVYTQETDRRDLNQLVSQRTLEEIYLAPFRAVVERAHADAVMCAYGAINGVNTCSDAAFYRQLSAWGFSGFVRSDLGAVALPGRAITAGLDVIKPAATSLLEHAVQSGSISESRINSAVGDVLTAVFESALTQPRNTVRPSMQVIAKLANSNALKIAERSIVLLKNNNGLLPIKNSTPSIAVIGTDGGSGAYSAGQGSAHVIGTPVAPSTAIASAFPQSSVAYSPAAATTPISTLFSSAIRGTVTTRPPQPAASPRQQVSTATVPQGGVDWSEAASSLVVQSTSTYLITMHSLGDAFLSLGGHQTLAVRGVQQLNTVTSTVQLSVGLSYGLSLDWASAIEGEPTVMIQDVGPALDAAAAAARAAAVALVFVSAPESEGIDRSTLGLPGYEDAMITAVATANPATIIVVNSGGAVLMPWLDHVQGVIEAWYPGRSDGTAIAAVLDGSVDPSGHLPITFPLSDAKSATAAVTSWPGLDGTVMIDGPGVDGLDIGYRWYHTTGTPVLFPFGYGLSFTSFAFSKLAIRAVGSGYSAAVRVKNTGGVGGRALVQAYLAYPGSTGEPVDQLKAFSSIDLAPGQSSTVTVRLPRSAFQVYLGRTWRTVSGIYRLSIGDSSADLSLSGQIPIR